MQQQGWLATSLPRLILPRPQRNFDSVELAISGATQQAIVREPLRGNPPSLPFPGIILHPGGCRGSYGNLRRRQPIKPENAFWQRAERPARSPAMDLQEEWFFSYDSPNTWRPNDQKEPKRKRLKMWGKLIQGFIAFPGRAARNNVALQQPARRRRWISVAVSVLALSLLAGCGGPSQQVINAQALSQAQGPNPNKELQQRLMLRASQVSLASYKDYKVGPEDQLAIEIFGQDKLNRTLRINGQGEITMPLVGVVKVAGLTPQGIEKRLVGLYDAQFLVNPQVTVAVKEFRHQRVAVTGAVEKPGPYEIIGPRTLLEVLSLAGGVSNRAGGSFGDVVDVIRHQNAPDLVKEANLAAAQPFAPKTETVVIDLVRLVSGETPELNLMVHNGDVIHVPFAGTAYVLGGVKKPGNITVKEKLTVSQAVALAGGVDPILGTNNITIMRFDAQGQPLRINTNLNSIISRKDPDLPVKDNDVVLVKESEIKKAIFVIRTLLPIPSGSYSMGAAGF